MMVVRLIKLVKVPCSSPCSLGGTWPARIDCSEGPAIPPRQYGTRKANIIHPSVAKANNTSPKVYKSNPR